MVSFIITSGAGGEHEGCVSQGIIIIICGSVDDDKTGGVSKKISSMLPNDPFKVD